jgi:hypothetical protein
MVVYPSCSDESGDKACCVGSLVLVHGMAGCGVELVLVQVAAEQVWVVQWERG